ncbi:MAG TPA: response regulator, partial [Chloroflexia bacterium]|nr:response regulator [Chloroflexia bacterium]
GREKMAQGDIDAAIVSVPLPDEGAAEMVGELHRANPSIPVLVLSRAEDSEIREEFVGAGASEVLSKECTFAQILTVVYYSRCYVAKLWVGEHNFSCPASQTKGGGGR